MKRILGVRRLSRCPLSYRPVQNLFRFLPKKNVAPNGYFRVTFGTKQTRSFSSSSAPAAESGATDAASEKKFKKFFVNGAFDPSKTKDKYMIDWKKHPDQFQKFVMEMLEDPGSYSAMFGPRSSTKSSRVMFAISKLQEEGKFFPVYISLEAFQQNENLSKDQFWEIFAPKFVDALKEYDDALKAAGKEGGIGKIEMPKIPEKNIEFWFESLFLSTKGVFTKRVVLILDEVDSILGNGLVDGKLSFLSLLRAIKHMGGSMIQSVMLVGTFNLYNVGDAAAVSKDLNAPGSTTEGGSPFNSSKFFPVGNFTQDQCNNLLDQMKQDRGIDVDVDVRRIIFSVTNGHAGAFCTVGEYIQEHPNAGKDSDAWMGSFSGIVLKYSETQNISRIVSLMERNPDLYNLWRIIPDEGIQVRAVDKAKRLAAVGALVRPNDGANFFKHTSHLMKFAINERVGQFSLPKGLHIASLLEKQDDVLSFGETLVQEGFPKHFPAKVMAAFRSPLIKSFTTDYIKTCEFPQNNQQVPNERAYRIGLDDSLFKTFGGPNCFKEYTVPSKGKPSAIDMVVNFEATGKMIAIEYCAHVGKSGLIDHAANHLMKTKAVANASPLLISFFLLEENLDFPEAVTKAMTAQVIFNRMMHFMMLKDKIKPEKAGNGPFDPALEMVYAPKAAEVVQDMPLSIIYVTHSEGSLDSEEINIRIWKKEICFDGIVAKWRKEAVEKQE